jgi:redox-sensitive bicupin YhaK (pirin superfamily)
MNSRSTQRHTQLRQGNHGHGFLDHNLFDQLGSLDPFINLDDFHMPQPFFPPHPHAGFSVMTYIFEDSEGAFINRDSLGDHSRIEPGGLHWTQAGRGVQHEEIPEQPGQDCHGLQMWVNHSDRDRHVAPRAWNLDAHEIPEACPNTGARVRVLVGEAFGLRAPFEPVTPITLLDVHLEPGVSLQLPAPTDRMALALVIRGAGSFGRDRMRLETHAAATFNRDDDTLEVQAGPDGLEVLIGTGKPYNEEFVFGGPFVGSTQQDVLEARARFQRGEMGLLEPSTAFGRR